MASGQKRSRTGCLTCRQRKLKCSEEKPICSQCAKANRECVLASGITFRHQQNPSMNADYGDNSLRSFYGYKETFGRGTVWVTVPRQLTFVHTSNPYEDEEEISSGNRIDRQDDGSLTTAVSPAIKDESRNVEYPLAQAAYPEYAMAGLEALSAVASQDRYAPPPAPMKHGAQMGAHEYDASPPQSTLSASQNLDFILNPAGSHLDPQLGPQTPTSPCGPSGAYQSPQHVRTTSYSSTHGRSSLPFQGICQSHDRRPAIDDPELAFLLRDFSERSGAWMDLNDLNMFNATTVPVLAVTCPLLLYSCTALSAKSLSRVHGRKPSMGGQVTEARKSKMERWPGPPMNAQEWAHRAREHYDLAVSLLRQALQGASRAPTSSLPEDVGSDYVSAVQQYPLPTTDSDELIAATAVMCVYEFLDASGPEWDRHLNGAKSLFDITNDGMVHLTRPASPVSLAQHVTRRFSGSSDLEGPRYGLSKGREAVFWNFARQDMLSAFINSTSTRLDTSDFLMWRSAGLKITREGSICLTSTPRPDYRRENSMQDDMICNALIWLVMKLLNFLASERNVHKTLDPQSVSLDESQRLEYWQELESQLDTWHQGLPVSFNAIAIRQRDSPMDIEQKWYSRAMYACAAQWWHFAQIHLVLNKPRVQNITHLEDSYLLFRPSTMRSTSLGAQHLSSLSPLQESRAHAKEILAIGLGRHDEGARIHSTQPIWTAGLVLGASEGGDVTEEVRMWRRSVLSQLRGIERDMGWASEYRVRSLLEMWGLPEHWGLDMPA